MLRGISLVSKLINPSEVSLKTKCPIGNDIRPRRNMTDMLLAKSNPQMLAFVKAFS